MVEHLVPELRAALAGVLPSEWRDAAPWGYPSQSELAVITGVFAAQIPAVAVAEIADTVMRRRPGRFLDDLSELAALDTLEVRRIVGERWGDSTVLGVPRRRADVIHEAAGALAALGVRTGRQLQEAVREREQEVAGALLGIRGLGPGTWESVVFQAHAFPTPGPDVIAYVRSLLGESGEDLDGARCRRLIQRAALRFGVETRVLAFALRRLVDERAREAAVPV